MLPPGLLLSMACSMRVPMLDSVTLCAEHRCIDKLLKSLKTFPPLTIAFNPDQLFAPKLLEGLLLG